MTTMRMSASPVRRSRSFRAAAAAVASIASSLVLLTAIPAQADEKSIIAEKSSWFWSSNSKITTCTGEVNENNPVGGLCGSASGSGGVQPGTTPGTTAPISFGHVGVSMKDGDSDMRAFVKFDNSIIPPGAQISSYIVTMGVSGVNLTDQDHAERHQDTKSKPPATLNQEQAAIQACAVAEPWASAEGDPPYSTTVTRPKPETTGTEDDTTQVTTVKNEPGYNSGLCAQGERAKDGSSWRFDITNIAKKWMSLEVFDEGIALIPVNNSVKPNWVVEFHGAPYESIDTDGETTIINVTKKEAARANVDYTGGTGPLLPPTTDPGLGTTGGSAPVPGFAPADEPVDTGTPAEQPSQQPVAGGVIPVGGKATVPGWLYALVPVFILGFGLVSGAIGADETVALAGANRVASVLQARRLGGAEALTAAEQIAAEEAASSEGPIA